VTPYYSDNLVTVYHGDNCDVMGTMPRECVDLVVTSPPYDDLRTYGGHSWDFYGVAWQLKRVLKPGGVIVWVVADATVDGSETGSSMEQALHFKRLGLNLHDTMIYHRQAANPSNNRYWQNWEYTFILSSGKPKTTNLLRDRKNNYRRSGSVFPRDANGERTGPYKSSIALEEFGYRENIWSYLAGGGHCGDGISHKHPAIFPEALARDHILSWSNPGDVVLDPFAGSGTTLKMAKETGRRSIGIEVNADYCEIIRQRVAQGVLFAPVGGAA
jgi:DNA modification methylase